MRQFPRSSLCALILCLGPAHAAVRYVNAAAPGTVHDGASWATAFLTVTDGLNASSGSDEVRVARGVYPGHIALRDAVALIGGYAGSGPSPDSRDVHANETVLDATGTGESVVDGDATVGAAVLDGFTLTGGTGDSDGNGGGIHLDSCGPTIRNDTIRLNRASGNGGGISVSGGAPVITNNTIVSNNAGNFGGAIYLSGSAAVVANNTLARNSGAYGGGMFEESGGAATVVNNTLVENAAASDLTSGALYSRDDTVFANNLVAYNSGGLRFEAASTQSHNNLLYGEPFGDYTGSVSAAPGDVRADPLIVRDAHGDYHIAPASPARNAGSNASVVGTTDIDGEPRIQQGTVDIGADESNGTATFTPSEIIVRVAPDGNDANNGATWASAKKTVQAAVQAASALGGEVWVKQGTYSGHVDLGISVGLYGGFQGSETARSQRPDPRLHPSVLDAGGSGDSVVTITPGTPATTVMDGFTIQHGAGASDGNGGGIHIANADPVIRNSLILLNSASGNGGAIAVLNGRPVLTNLTLNGNTAGNFGGGIYLSGSGATVANSTLARNAAGYGGGLFEESGGDARVVNNTFVENAAANVTTSGAVYARDGIAFANNLLAFNSGGVYTEAANSLSHNTLYYENATGDLGGSASPQAGDVAGDPALVRDVYGNYHIQPASAARNAGSNASVVGTTDIDGEPRIQQGTVDIGVDETNGAATFTPSVIVQHVTATGNDANDGKTWATARKSLQVAINALALGGEVWVAAGTYHEGDITPSIATSVYGGFLGTEANRAERPDPRLHPSILDASGLGGAVISVPAGIPMSTVIDGFTIENGSGAPDGTGGGIHITAASPVIRNNTLRANSASGNGGAISAGGGSAPLIASNVITLNAAGNFGGGIYAADASRIANNLLDHNSAAYGGGVFVESTSDARLVNNTFFANHASSAGGGVYTRQDITVASNVFDANEAPSGGGMTEEAASTRSDGNLMFKNTGGDYGGNAAAGPHDLSADPLLMNPGAGDYRLQTGSPAVNAGDDAAVLGAADVRGALRVTGDRVDIGAYELQANLNLAASVSNAVPLTATPVVYTFTVTNSGPDPAKTVRLTDNLPAGFGNVSVLDAGGGVSAGSGGSRTVTFSSLAPGASVKVTLQATPDCSLPDGTGLTNTASVSTVPPPAVPTPDPVAGDNTAGAPLSVVNPPPTISDTGAAPSLLLRADHRMVEVTVSDTVTDNCDAAPKTVLSATSNEADTGTGAGDLPGDIEVVDSHHIRVRAERAGRGQARVYTVTITATDSGGGSTQKTITVTVPAPALSDARDALRIAGGLSAAGLPDIGRLDVDGNAAIDLRDAVHTAREVEGLEP